MIRGEALGPKAADLVGVESALAEKLLVESFERRHSM
jgi:hypothetical protein